MIPEFESSFPRNFDCRVVSELPGAGATQLYFPPGLTSGQDGLMVRVSSGAGREWSGTFAFGQLGGVTVAFSMPDPDRLGVVASGAGYTINATDPSEWETIDAIPILAVRAIPAAGLVVFANHTELLAHGAHGVKWRTKRLSFDSLTIIEVNDKSIVGEYWSPLDDAMVRFEVDLATGISSGGVPI